MRTTGHGTAVRLMDRDYDMLRDIFEFYFIDFHAARLRFWNDAPNEGNARRYFNRRMLQLVKHELISPVSFFSERRPETRGSANYAYTLTKKGVQLLSAIMETELEWDSGKKDRQILYIQHHINVLHYTYLYHKLIESGELEAYYGENSSRFQMENQDAILKDFVKPDATLFFRTSQMVVPWVVEYERNSRASKKTILTKLKNHSEYAVKGLYKQHAVMKAHDTDARPVLLFYCEEMQVAQRRLQIMASERLTFNSNDSNGYAEVLFAAQKDVEQRPYEAVYSRTSGEKVRLQQINHVQVVSRAFTENSIAGLPADIQFKWFPAYIASRQSIYLDGIYQLSSNQTSAAMAIRFISESMSDAELSRDFKQYADAVEQNKWAEHPIMKNNIAKNKPVFLFVVETLEQEQRVIERLIQTRLQEKLGWRCLVTRLDLILDSPYRNVWLPIDSTDRVRPI